MTTQKTIYQGIDDNLYDLTNNLVPADKDSNGRSASYISAQTDGQGTLAIPLNTGKTTIFEFNQPPGKKIRWGTCGLRLSMVFHKSGDTTAAVPDLSCYPPWCLPAVLIRNLKIELNSGGVLYQNADGHYLEEFIARAFRTYDRNTLNRMEESFFTPINQYAYSEMTSTTGTLGAMTDPTSTLKANDYCLAANNTQNREFVKIISFLDLFPRLPDAIYKNLRKFKLTIVWENTGDLLNKRCSFAGEFGVVALTKADIVTDFYHPSGSQVQETVLERIKELKDDYLPFLETYTTTAKYTTGNDITIPSIKNFHSVFICQLAKNQSNGKDIATANYRGHSGVGEFLFFGSSIAANATLKTRQCLPAGVPANTICGAESVQIVVGGTSYPDQPISTIKSSNGVNSFDGNEIYHEYLKGINRFADKFRAGAIDYNTFQSCMPFVYLCPSTSNAVHPDPNGCDLTIKIRGGADCDISIVVFKVKTVVLAPSGISTDY
jgi:hypothetical protein